VHVVGPQLGLTMPGLTVVCGDSHTSTHGAFGALAFGIGTSEVEHVLATQTLPLSPFKTMAITVDGALRPGTTAKDIILAVIAKIGTGGGQGYVLEYRGEAIRALSMEARMTICNMSIEAGARAGMIAPDAVTFGYLKGRPHAPEGADWDAAVAYWSTLKSDDDAVFDVEVTLDASELEPFVTWGTNPGQGLPLSANVPIPAQIAASAESDRQRRRIHVRAGSSVACIRSRRRARPGRRAGARPSAPRASRRARVRRARGRARRGRVRPRGWARRASSRCPVGSDSCQ